MTEIPADFTGLIPPEELSNDDYHARDEISSSMLKLLDEKTPAHVKGAEAKKGAALDRGTAYHTGLLEPHNYETTLMRGPADRRGKKWADAQEKADADGKILLVEGDFDDGLRIRDAVHGQPHIANLLQKNNRQIEYSAFAELDGVRQRTRPDVYLPDDEIMIDPKSTQSASYDDFQRAIVNYRYHIQAAMYPYVWEGAGGGKVREFLFLAIETKPPFAAALFELDHECFDEGWTAYRNAVELYKECVATDTWPGYPTETQTMALPRWYKSNKEGI